MSQTTTADRPVTDESERAPGFQIDFVGLLRNRNSSPARQLAVEISPQEHPAIVGGIIRNRTDATASDPSECSADRERTGGLEDLIRWAERSLPE